MKFKKLFDRKNKDYVTIKVNTSNVPDGLLEIARSVALLFWLKT